MSQEETRRGNSTANSSEEEVGAPPRKTDSEHRSQKERAEGVQAARRNEAREATEQQTAETVQQQQQTPVLGGEWAGYQGTSVLPPGTDYFRPVAAGGAAKALDTALREDTPAGRAVVTTGSAATGGLLGWMVSDESGWGALAGALLGIGTSTWAMRRAGDDGMQHEGPSQHARAGRPAAQEVPPSPEQRALPASRALDGQAEQRRLPGDELGGRRTREPEHQRAASRRRAETEQGPAASTVSTTSSGGPSTG